jgi:acetyl esterase
MWRQYVGAQETDGYAAPLYAPDLVGLPPAHIAVGACDPVRDDARVYAKRLREQGVLVSYEEHERLPHGIFTYFGRVDSARAAVIAAAGALQVALQPNG